MEQFKLEKTQRTLIIQARTLFYAQEPWAGKEGREHGQQTHSTNHYDRDHVSSVQNEGTVETCTLAECVPRKARHRDSLEHVHLQHPRSSAGKYLADSKWFSSPSFCTNFLCPLSVAEGSHCNLLCSLQRCPCSTVLQAPHSTACHGLCNQSAKERNWETSNYFKTFSSLALKLKLSIVKVYLDKP